MMRWMIAFLLLVTPIYGAGLGVSRANNQAVSYAQKGQFDGALKAYAKALAHDEKSDHIKRNMARTFYQMGDYNKARESLSQDSINDLSHDEQAQYFYDYGLIAAKQRELEEAKALFMKSLLLDPSNMKAKQALEKLLQDIEQKKQAQQPDDKKDKSKNKKDKSENKDDKADQKPEKKAQDEQQLDQIRKQQQEARKQRQQQASFVLKEMERQEKEARKRFLLKQAPEEKGGKDW